MIGAVNKTGTRNKNTNVAMRGLGGRTVSVRNTKIKRIVIFKFIFLRKTTLRQYYFANRRTSTYTIVPGPRVCSRTAVVTLFEIAENNAFLRAFRSVESHCVAVGCCTRSFNAVTRTGIWYHNCIGLAKRVCVKVLDRVAYFSTPSNPVQ
jgi:hypothetical protein